VNYLVCVLMICLPLELIHMILDYFQLNCYQFDKNKSLALLKILNKGTMFGLLCYLNISDNNQKHVCNFLPSDTKSIVLQFVEIEQHHVEHALRMWMEDLHATTIYISNFIAWK